MATDAKSGQSSDGASAGACMVEIERGRGDLTLARIRDNWTSQQSPFDRHDLAALHRHRAALTAGPVPVVAVSRGGIDCPGLDAVYGPDDLLTAWPL